MCIFTSVVFTWNHKLTASVYSTVADLFEQFISIAVLTQQFYQKYELFQILEAIYQN